MNPSLRLIVLSLLAISLLPHSSYALPDQENPGAPPTPTPQSAMPSQLILPINTAIAMAVHRNIDLRIESQNSRMATVDEFRSHGIYNPVLNVSSTGGVSAVPGDAFFSTKTMNTTVGMTQNLPTGGSITASTQAGYFRYEPAVSGAKEWQSTAGLAFTQPLLRNAGMETFELNITLSANTLQDSLERFRSTTSDTVSNVITSYNRLYVLRQIQDTREAALRSALSLLDEIKKKGPGTAQGLEVANAEFAISQRRKDFVEASRSVSDQETNLRYLIGLETPVRIVPSDPPSKEEPAETDEQAVKAALDLRSDLKQLKISLQSAQVQERVASHQSLPDLSVNASGGFSGTGYNFGESYRGISNHPGTYWTAGMQFSIPLGNTAARNDYIRTKIRAEQAQDQIRALTWRIRNDVEYDMRSLISARLQIQLADKSSQFAEQRLDEYRKNNRLNQATIQDVLNAENDLNVARNAQLEAVETFSNAVVKLWKDTGLLLDHYGIHIDRSKLMSSADSGEENPSLNMDLPVDTGQASKPPAVPEPVPRDVLPPAPPARESIPAVAEKPANARGESVPATSAAPPAINTSFTLSFGEFASKSVMEDAIEKINSVGLVPKVEQGPQKTEHMIRLYLAEYPSHLQAQKALKKLQRVKGNGFIQMNDNKRYVVYAGSFSSQDLALKEQQRLAGLKIKVRPEKTSVSFPTYLLTAGTFQGREAPLEYARKLELLGLKPVLTEKP